ncbi:MAG: MoxR family ATPase [Deltaproteobacteria bacterium]|nr:MoxR family ATPase [Deltaproteobacteria bacterium]
MDVNLCQKIIQNIGKVIVGKQRPIELLLVALLAEGHVLLEDVPGVAKTLLAKCLAGSIGGSFNRIQFTPDLMPTDITGFNVYDQRSARFSFRPGPVITHVLLADEINRTIPRTQSSLLECMQERQVTVDGTTHVLPRPFFVMATQNPIELEGTFPLPEAQLDRFLLKTQLGYPEEQEEVTILERFQQSDPLQAMAAVASPEDVSRMQEERRTVTIAEPLRRYIAAIVRSTREHAAVRYGASPRGSLGLMRAGQALAALRGRQYALPDDIKSLAVPVLAHRLILLEQDKLRGTRPEEILNEIVEKIPVPTI